LLKTVIFLFIPFYLLFLDSYSQTSWNDYIKVYRQFGSPFIGGNCQMYPSCSKYADLQFKTFGFTKAFTNTADRLIRCSHDFTFYDIQKENGNLKFLDFGNDSLNNLNAIKWNKGVYAYSSINEKELHFINYLINQGHFNEALLEINKNIFNGSKEKDLWVNYLRVLRKLNFQERIILDFETIFPNELKNSPEVLFEIGLSQLEINNTKKASILFDQIIKNDAFLDNLSYQQSLIYQTYIAAKNKDFTNSIFFNNKISNPAFKSQKSINEISINNLKNFKPKNITTATILGIIPGLGYLYSKHPKSAFSSLVMNGLIGFATYTSFKTQNSGLGILLGITTLGFYFGNIKGGKNAAIRYNETFTNSQLKKLYPNFSL